MGWLFSHTELLPKLWGARRPPQDSAPGHLHCDNCRGLRVSRPTGELGDMTFGTAPPWPRSPRQQDNSWQEQLRPAQQAQPRFRKPPGFIHKLLRLPKLQVMHDSGPAGAEAAGPAVVPCTRSAWPHVGAGGELRVPGEPCVPAPVRACPCVRTCARVPCLALGSAGRCCTPVAKGSRWGWAVGAGTQLNPHMGGRDQHPGEHPQPPWLPSGTCTPRTLGVREE